MPAGRPPGLSLDPETPGPVHHGTVEIDNRGRARLPARIVHHAAWLRTAPDGADALAILFHPGCASLLSWTECAAPILQRRRDLIARASSDAGALEALRVLEDRYKRIKIPADLRPTLTREIRLHLEITLEQNSTIFLACVAERLELTSPSYRNRLLLRDWDELRDLPE